MASDEIGGMCRFYDKEFPDVEESVIVNVKRIAEMGAYVQVRGAPAAHSPCRACALHPPQGRAAAAAPSAHRPSPTPTHAPPLFAPPPTPLL
jgi:hypothetical protein